MSFGFGSGPREATCRFCGRSLHPELLTSLNVPYLASAFEVCPTCRADYEDSGWRVEPFVPAVELPSHSLWPEPRDADLDGTEGDLRAGIEAYVEARLRLERLAREEEGIRSWLAAAPPARPLRQLWLREEALAQLAFGLDPELEPLLRSAWEALDEALPNYSLNTELHARVGFLLAKLTLELGERAPRSYGPRKQGPGVWLKELRDQARQVTALRDPRVPLLRALIYREEDNLGGVDAELREALAWLEALPPEPWREVAFTTHYDLHLRANDGRRWEESLRHLKRCCALRPDEPQLFLRLAHAYLACAQPHVAREVLAARLGPDAVTPAAVQDHVASSLNELRPLLEARYAAHPDEPDRVHQALGVLYATCLLGLSEHDLAWRAIGGDDLAAEPTESGPEHAERLHLAGLIARKRGAVEVSARLLTRGVEATPAGASVHTGIHHDLLSVLTQTARELLEELEERTRGPAARRTELVRALESAEDPDRVHELRQELARTEQELAQAIRGPDNPADPLAVQGLEHLHGLIGRHAPQLLAATSEYERTVFAEFLGRELSGRFRPLVTPPSLADRDDVRVSDARLRIDLTYRALAKRRLPDALRQDRAARDATGHATPVHLLLTYLELVRRGGPLVHAWATWAWTQLPARRPAIEVGLLIVPAEALAQREVGFLLELFDEPTRGPTVGRPSLRGLQDRCRLQFPGDALPGALARDPAVRAFVRALSEACPAFPFVLDLSAESGQLELFFGCLASPDALQDQAPVLNLLDVSVVDPVRAALAAMRALATEIGLDPDAVCAPLLSRYPPERRAELLG